MNPFQPPTLPEAGCPQREPAEKGSVTARRWMAGLTLAAGVTLLAACSSSSGNDASGSTPSSDVPATTSAAAPATSAPAAGTSTGGTPAARVCAFLEQQKPQVAQAKSASDAKTVLTINLATFASQNPDLRTAVSSDFDQLATQGCAATRTTILAKLGAASFSKALDLS
jgi:hypothetical protein